MNYTKVTIGFLMVTLMLFIGVNGWAAEKAQEVVIGYTAPLSGPAAEYGQDCVNGVDMAINEINKAGGITVKGKKYTFKLEKLDDRIDPTQAVNNARRFRDQFKTPAIFNPVFNTITPMMQINQEKGNEFLMMAYTSTPKVTALNNKLLVAIPPNFEIYVQAFSDMAWGQGARKAAMIVTLGAYGDEWRAAFKKYWEKKGRHHHRRQAGQLLHGNGFFRSIDRGPGHQTRHPAHRRSFGPDGPGDRTGQGVGIQRRLYFD